MLIVFIGIDGSGKTTLARKTVELLTKKGIEAIYVFPFEYICLKYLLVLLKRLKKSRDKKNPYLTTSKKPIIMKLWPYLALIDHLFYYMIKIKPLLKGNKWVICDRYFYDFIASFEYYKYADKFIGKFYYSLIRQPDLAFVLDVTPEIAKKREGEHNFEYYVKQRKCYQCIAKKLNFKIINTDQELNMTEKVLDRYIVEKSRQKDK